MSTHLPTLVLSIEQRLVATELARLSRGTSAILISTLSLLCWAALVVIALALWELV